MALTSPAVILYDADGHAMAVQDGVVIPANTPGLLVLGKDPANASRFVRMAVDGTVRTDPTGTTTQPVSGTVTANQGAPNALANAWPVGITDGASGPATITVVGPNKMLDVNVVGGPAPGFVVKELRAPNSALSNVAASIVNVLILAANANRLGFRVYNDSNQRLYVKFGAVASTVSYTVKLDPNSYLEEIQYTGQVDGIWNVANGAARVTELT